MALRSPERTYEDEFSHFDRSPSSVDHIASELDKSLVVAPEEDSDLGAKAALVIAQLRHEVHSRDDEIGKLKRDLARKDFDLARKGGWRGTGTASRPGTPHLPGTPQRTAAPGFTATPNSRSFFPLAARGARSAYKPAGSRLAEVSPSSPAPFDTLDAVSAAGSDSEDGHTEADVLFTETAAERDRLAIEVTSLRTALADERANAQAERVKHAEEIDGLHAALAARDARLEELERRRIEELDRRAPSLASSTNTNSAANQALIHALRSKIDEQRQQIDTLKRSEIELAAKVAAKEEIAVRHTSIQAGSIGAGSDPSRTPAALAKVKTALQEDWARLSGTLFYLVDRLSSSGSEETEVGSASPNPLGLSVRSNRAPSKLEEPPAQFSPTYLHRATKHLLSLLDTHTSNLITIRSQEDALYETISSLRKEEDVLADAVAALRAEEKLLSKKAKQLAGMLKKGVDKLAELDKLIKEKTERLERRRKMEAEVFGLDRREARRDPNGVGEPPRGDRKDIGEPPKQARPTASALRPLGRSDKENRVYERV